MFKKIKGWFIKRRANKVVKETHSKLRRWILAVISMITSLVLVLRVPVFAATLSSFITGKYLDKAINDKYIKAIVATCIAVVFLILIVNYSWIGWIAASIGCYRALDHWYTSVTSGKAFA